MPAKKPKPEEKPQPERFIEAARLAEADETEEGAQKGFEKVILSEAPVKNLAKSSYIVLRRCFLMRSSSTSTKR